MKTYILNFNIEDWCKHLEIEAENEQEAEEKLYRMTTEEIVAKGIMYGVYEIKDLEVRKKDE